MEVPEVIGTRDGSKRHTLTPLRIFRGLMCLTVLLTTAFLFLAFCAPVAAFLFRLVSLNFSRRSVSFLFSIWLALWPFFFEKINGTKMIFYGETVPSKERVLLISNHRTEVDWMYLWDLALRKGCLGHLKYVLKKSLMKLPVMGWGFHVLEFISVERKWEIDEPVMQQTLATFTNRNDPLWLALFPEGTDYTDLKCKKSQQYAIENGLPVLNNVLLPKTKGFYVCLDTLRGSLDAVYDVTIAYKNQCPSFMDNVYGVDPSEVHMHIRRIPLDKVPVTEPEVADWLMNTYKLKDQLLSDFTSNGHFPSQGTEAELSTKECMMNLVTFTVIIGMFVYLGFFASVWFKVYIGLSCVYLTIATCFNIRAVPVFGVVEGLFRHQKSKM